MSSPRPKASPGPEVGTVSLHMSGNVLSLSQQKERLMQKLDKVNEQIEARRKQSGDVENQEGVPLMGELQDEEDDMYIVATARSGSTERTTSEKSYARSHSQKISSIADEDEAEKVRHHFDYPSEFSLIVFQVGMSLGYCGYVMTSWLYIGAVRHDVFPDCNKVWPYSHEMSNVCEFSVLAFWTFPIFCCIFLLIFFYRDLLCTRLYYEMLCHNVFLDLENVDFFQSQAVRFLLFWMGTGVLMYPATGNLHFAGMKATVAYWIPVASYFGMLYASWDLETRLLSLSKYVEREFDDAKVHMQNSVFLRDYLCRRAFERVRDTSRKMQKIHSTGSYVKAVVKMAIKMCRTEKEWSMAFIGDEHSGYDSFFVAFSSNYWVTDFLYCPQLADQRAQKFRTWFRVYMIYTWSLMFFFAYLGVATIVSHLYHQRIIEESFFTRWFKVENFLVVPVGPSHQGEEADHHASLLLRVIDHLTRL